MKISSVSCFFLPTPTAKICLLELAEYLELPSGLYPFPRSLLVRADIGRGRERLSSTEQIFSSVSPLMGLTRPAIKRELICNETSIDLGQKKVSRFAKCPNKSVLIY